MDTKIALLTLPHPNNLELGIYIVRHRGEQIPDDGTTNTTEKAIIEQLTRGRIIATRMIDDSREPMDILEELIRGYGGRTTSYIGAVGPTASLPIDQVDRMISEYFI